MKTNKAFLTAIIVLVIGTMAAVAVAGQTTSGWPPANILKEYGIEGMPQPTGANSVWWRRAAANEGLLGVPNLLIGFKGTNAAGTAIKNWFDRSGWNQTSSNRNGGAYRKANSQAYYDFSDGTGQIVAGIKEAASAGGRNSALYGEWTGGPKNGSMAFMGPNEWEPELFWAGTYSYDGTTITVEVEGKSGTAQATISGNTLTIGRFTGNVTSEGINDYIPGTYRKVR
jgi:hypothetical protein